MKNNYTNKHFKYNAMAVGIGFAIFIVIGGITGSFGMALFLAVVVPFGTLIYLGITDGKRAIAEVAVKNDEKYYLANETSINEIYSKLTANLKINNVEILGAGNTVVVSRLKIDTVSYQDKKRPSQFKIIYTISMLDSRILKIHLGYQIAQVSSFISDASPLIKALKILEDSEETLPAILFCIKQS